MSPFNSAILLRLRRPRCLGALPWWPPLPRAWSPHPQAWSPLPQAWTLLPQAWPPLPQTWPPLLVDGVVTRCLPIS